MASPFHRGELAVQAKAGVLADAARVGQIIRPEISPSAMAYLARQQFAIVGTADSDGQAWASLVAGSPGVLRASDPRTLEIAALPSVGDPFVATLERARDQGAMADAGVLVIDLATRRRLRLNGPAELTGAGMRLHVRQAFWNCPKYIQERLLVRSPHVDSDPAPERQRLVPARSASLGDAQRASIANADTFFIASIGRDGSADASHRGGEPGFVQVTHDATDGTVLVFPDYSGNNMFNTLGNLTEHSAAGLLFIDFEHGATLQLTGTATVLWDREQIAPFPGAERAVRFRVAEVIETPHGTALRWYLIERSPFNPPPPSRSGARLPAARSR